MTIEATLGLVRSSGRTSMNPGTRVTQALAVGTQRIQQGDVYMTRLPDDFDLRDYHEVQDHQVVPRDGTGDSSTGARHVISNLPACRVMVPNDASEDPLVGPVVVAPEGFYLEHPKHGDHDVRQAGVFQVTYQLDCLAAERAESRRRAD